MSSCRSLVSHAVAVLIFLGVAMTADAGTRTHIAQESWGMTSRGQTVELFTLSRGGVPTVTVTSYYADQNIQQV